MDTGQRHGGAVRPPLPIVNTPARRSRGVLVQLHMGLISSSRRQRTHACANACAAFQCHGVAVCVAVYCSRLGLYRQWHSPGRTYVWSVPSKVVLGGGEGSRLARRHPCRHRTVWLYSISTPAAHMLRNTSPVLAPRHTPVIAGVISARGYLGNRPFICAGRGRYERCRAVFDAEPDRDWRAARRHT